MKKTHQLAALLWLVVVSLSSSGQTQVDVRTQTKNVDFSGSSSTIPAKSGATLPTTCKVGEMFFNTSSAPGQNLYTCTPANTWTIIAGGASATGTILSATGGQFAYYGTNGTTLQGHTLAAGDIPALSYQAPLTFTGTGAKTASATGTFTPNDCAKWDGNGNVIDAGVACGSGSGSGDVAAPSALIAFRKALANAANQVVRIKVFGDSISRCINGISCSSNPNPTGPSDKNSLWPNALRTALTNAGYISHGTGMLPIISAATGTPYTDTSVWTMSGTAFTTSNILGPNQTPSAGTTLATLVKMPPAAVATMSAQSGSTLIVYCATYTDSTSGLNVAIDGTSVGTACGSTSTTATAVAASFTVAGGAHTVVLTSNSTGNAYLYGAEWVSNTNGVAVDNYSVGSMQALGFVGNEQFSDLQTGDALTIIALGTNEAENGTTSTYSANLASIASHQVARGSSILMFAETPCNNVSCSTYQPTVVSLMQSLAQASGYGYVSAYTQWPSYAAANSMNLFTDGLHPTDAGQMALASLVNYNVLGALAASTPSSAFMNGALNISQSTANGGFNPMLNLYSNSTVTGTDVNVSFANSAHQYRIGLQQPTGDFYLFDKTNSRYNATWDTNGSLALTANANYSPLYIANTGTGNSANAAIIFQGNGRKFFAGVGNSSDTTFGCANKWCIYDVTASANRANMDSTGIYTINQGVRIPSQTFANWTPCSATYDGTIVRISDSTVTSGGITVGGGSNLVNAICNGSVPSYQVLGSAGGGSGISTPAFTGLAYASSGSNILAAATPTNLISLLGYMPLNPANNLNDIVSPNTALANLGGQAALSFTGSGSKTVSATGAGTSGNCATWTAAGNIGDAGTPCGSGGGTAGVSSFSGDGSLIINSSSTGAVTVALGAQSPHKVLAGPASGTASAVPAFRVLNLADLPLTFTGTGSKTASATAVGASGDCVTWTSSGDLGDSGAPCGSGGGSSAFSALTAGTNSTAAMVVGSGASIATSGTGTIAATSVPATGVTGTLTTSQLPATISAPPYFAAGGNYYIPMDGMSQATRPNGLTGWTNLSGATYTANITNGANGDTILTSSGGANGAWYAQAASTTSIEAVYQGMGYTGGGSVGLFLYDSTNSKNYTCYSVNSSGNYIEEDVYTYNGSTNPTYSVAGSKLLVSSLSDFHLKLSVSGTTATCAVSSNGGQNFTTVSTFTVGTVSKLGFYVGGQWLDVQSVVLH